MKTQTVEILITVAQDAESKLYDGDPKFSGEYILRALDADGVLLSESHVTLTDLAIPPHNLTCSRSSTACKVTNRA